MDYLILNDTFSIANVGSNINDDPILLSKKLNKLMLKLKGANLLDEKSIDYANLVESELFKNEYLSLTNELKHVCLNKLSDNEDANENIISFFINIYNSLTIHAIAHLSSEKQSRDSTMLNLLEGKFWSKVAYKIDNYSFSLDDIEHGILRCNRPHPSTKRQSFEENDPRLKFAAKKFDCRIHFALNCGAKGCPPVSFYAPQNLDHSLKLAAINFCTNEIEVDLSEKSLTLSRLFLWYKSDFLGAQNSDNEEKNPEDILIRFIEQNLRFGDIKYHQFLNLIQNTEMSEIKLKFSTYDWNINAKN